MEMTRRRRFSRLPAWATRHPWLALLGGVSTALILGAWAWWATQLWGLPDIGDPFDVAAFEAAHIRVRVEDDRNAFVEYREAHALLKGPLRTFQTQRPWPGSEKDPRTWAEAGPEWRTLLAASQTALAAYRAGSEKPDALYTHPEGLGLNTLLPVTFSLRMLGRLAVLEGKRLEAEGDMAGAWGWYRAALRSSRHTGRHGFQIERTVGAAIHKQAADAIGDWSGDPRVDAPLLRRARAEVIAIDALTAPRSDAIKMEYLIFLHDLDDPGNLIDYFFIPPRQPDDPADWVQDLSIPAGPKTALHRGRFVINAERERAIRISRLLVANWLAEEDKPAARRARLASMKPPIYEAGPGTPPEARRLAPAKLAAWYESSFLTRRFYGVSYQTVRFIDRERAAQETLVRTLDRQIERRDKAPEAPPPPSAPDPPIPG
ncbi:hypothetical protein TA3x_001929 [Tundrisphaera sp. TA3]|uniref:hypothetical protein n=1 Tax=Tundrisphaera sp. TA3 TaxID=3435775 RepID=UPI003EBF4C1D